MGTLHALPRFVVVGSFDFLGGFFSSLYPSFAFGSSEEIDLCVERERKNEWEDVEEWVKRLWKRRRGNTLKPDIDFGAHFGVKLPGLPSAPKLPGIGGKAPKVKMGEGPKKNEYLEIRAKPILPKRVSGASRFVCLEIAYVIQAGARCYRRGYTGSVTTGDIDVLTSAGSSIYNKIGGLLPGSTKKAPSKPSGKGAAHVDEDGDEA